MGLFGGKDKKKTKSHRRGSGDGESRRTSRKSRRIAAPTQGGENKANTRRTSRKIEVPQQQKDSGSKPLDLQSGDDDILDNSAFEEPGISESPDEILLDSSTSTKPSGVIGQAAAEDEGLSRSGDQPLLDFLINKVQMINEEQAEQMRQRATAGDQPIDVIGVQMEFFTEDELVNALTQECWVPHLKVDKYDIRKKALDTINAIDAKNYSVLPVDKLGGILNLAMVNPLDTEAIRILESRTGLDIKKVVATRSEIDQGIARYYGGEVELQDREMQIVQDLPSQRVTQMIAKTGSGAAPAPSESVSDNVAVPDIDDAFADDDEIVDIDEIADIDDLLTEPGTGEHVQPAIIDSISVEQDDILGESEDEDQLIEPGITSREDDIQLDDADLELIDTGPVAPEEPVLDLDDEPAISAEPAISEGEPAAVTEPEPAIAEPEPVITESEPAIAEPEPVISDPGAPELDLNDPFDDIDQLDTEDHTDTDELGIGDEDLEPVVPLTEPDPAATAPVPEPVPVPVPVPTPAAPAAKSEERSGSMLKKDPATARFKAPGKKGARAEVIELMEVLEEEFQHAITHSKSHVFEKWSALQTRNRILNAISIPEEMGGMLSGLEQEQTIKAEIA